MVKQWSQPTNRKSVGYKFFQRRAGFKGFVFTGLKDVWSRNQSMSEWQKRRKMRWGRQKGREKVRDGVRDRHRDARKTARERNREVERKCDLVWVFWAACSICPPWQRGRVTGIGRNWISRLNTPSFPSSFFPFLLLSSLPSPPLFSPLHLFSGFFDRGNVVEIAGRDVLAKCS